MTSRLHAPLLFLIVLVAMLPGAASGAATADTDVYRVGPGDTIAVSIHPGTGDPLEIEVPVAGDGTIDVAHAGRLKVTGMTTSEIQDLVRRRLVASQLYKELSVAVNVKTYMSQGVNVTGAVNEQGRFYLQRATRLLDVLSMAKGIKDEVAGNWIVIHREGATEPLKIDRRDLVGADLEKSQAANVRVLAGDNIHVPIKEKFCVGGSVKNPGCYTLEDGMNIQQAISSGGGIDPEVGDRKHVSLRRKDGGEEIHLDLDQVESGAVPAPPLMADDQIIVTALAKTRFCVDGAVMKADCFDYAQGLTLEGAISKAQGLEPETGDRKNIIVRRDVDGKLQTYNLSLDESGEKGPRFPIISGDQVLVGKADCLITVGGAVKTASQIHLKTGMGVADAITAAGGTFGEGLWGKASAVRLIRQDGKTVVVNVKAVFAGKQTDVPLMCGDKIFVPARKM